MHYGKYSPEGEQMFVLKCILYFFIQVVLRISTGIVSHIFGKHFIRFSRNIHPECQLTNVNPGLHYILSQIIFYEWREVAIHNFF